MIPAELTERERERLSEGQQSEAGPHRKKAMSVKELCVYNVRVCVHAAEGQVEDVCIFCSGIFSRLKDHDQARQSNNCKQQMCTDDSTSSAPRILPRQHSHLCHVVVKSKKGTLQKMS